MSNKLVPRGAAAPANLSRSVSGEIVDIGLVDRAYDELRLDELLLKYARHEGGYGAQRHLETAFALLAGDLASLAYDGRDIDVAMARHGFDRTASGMNAAAADVRGNELRIRKGPLNGLLVKAGVVEPEFRTAVRPLDDRYWQEQFLEQFENGSRIPRHPDESEHAYLTRYIHYELRGLLWAPFTYTV